MSGLSDLERAAIVAQLSYELEPVTPLPSWNAVAMETVIQLNRIRALEADAAQAADRIAALEAELARAEADKAAMVFVPPHLVDELAEWVLSEQAHWPEDTAYQSDLATFSASLRDLGGAL
ncbi:MAG: hypothetical protein JWQ44_2934 [Chthoniobacter sp.]|nr:hypothetical protein [Chthoniobacter sp.]